MHVVLNHNWIFDNMKFLVFTALFFVSTSQQCPSNDQHCVACYRNRCLICMDSWISENGVCVPVENRIADCLSYIDANNCRYCKVGYYRTEQGNCAPINIADCYEARSPTSCIICKQGIRAVDGVCSADKICPRRNCELCGVYGKRVVCTKCKPGYTMVTRQLRSGRRISVCLRQRRWFRNCSYLSRFSNRKCAVCEVNYFWSSGKCLPSMQYFLKNTVEKLPVIMMAIFSLLVLN